MAKKKTEKKRVAKLQKNVRRTKKKAPYKKGNAKKVRKKKKSPGNAKNVRRSVRKPLQKTRKKKLTGKPKRKPAPKPKRKPIRKPKRKPIAKPKRRPGKKPKAKKKVRVTRIESNVNLNSLPNEIKILSKNYKTKYIIITLEKEEVETQSMEFAISVIQDEGAELYNVMDVIVENEGEIDSPQFKPFRIQEIYISKSKMIYTVDFSVNKITPSVSVDIWVQYRTFYLKNKKYLN